MRHINEIDVHCSATLPGWMEGKTSAEKVAEIKRWHIEERHFDDIGYHWIIDRDGTIVAGRKLETVGAHIMGHNANSIGVCLIGGHGSAATDRFEENFTVAQDLALRALIADMKRIFGDIKVAGHNQYAAKACPGFNVPLWYKRTQNMEPKAPLVNQPTAMPTRKVIAGTLSGAIVAGILAFMQVYNPATYVAFGPVIQQFAPVVIGAVTAYFTRNRAA
jgi:hypothetical protein